MFKCVVTTIMSTMFFQGAIPIRDIQKSHTMMISFFSGNLQDTSTLQSRKDQFALVILVRVPLFEKKLVYKSSGNFNVSKLRFNFTPVIHFGLLFASSAKSVRYVIVSTVKDCEAEHKVSSSVLTL